MKRFKNWIQSIHVHHYVAFDMLRTSMNTATVYRKCSKCGKHKSKQIYLIDTEYPTIANS